MIKLVYQIAVSTQCLFAISVQAGNRSRATLNSTISAQSICFPWSLKLLPLFFHNTVTVFLLSHSLRKTKVPFYVTAYLNPGLRSNLANGSTLCQPFLG